MTDSNQAVKPTNLLSLSLKSPSLKSPVRGLESLPGA